MNKKILFNNGWKFAKTVLDVTDDKGLIYEPVDIPHDWLIYDTQNLYEDSIGWYKKNLYHNKDSFRTLLCFDGVYMDSYLYVNGNYIGCWKYGYSSFEHDITDALNEGDNEILLKVVHQGPNSRWYSGAGIYRNVWLKTRHDNYIETNGVYISTKQMDKQWQVEVDTSLVSNKNVQLSHTITYKDKEIASSSETIEESQTNSQILTVNNPHLWSPDSPNLYKITTRLEDMQGNLLESITQNLGFKTVILDPNKGFILNNKQMKLYGVCEHHDLGALGAAFNKAALIHRLKLLKEMGVNAIRTTHNMPAPELMDLADEMGFLIVSEAFDMWERPKTTYDYARFFKEWSAIDVKSWVMRDRNHPSLILWSIGNEIYDTHADERGLETTKRLMDLVYKYDPKKNAQVTFGSNFIPWENTQKCADLLKIVGYNYAERYYEDHHKKYPDWVIYGSETASTVQSRGVYHFPVEKSLMAEDDEQCSCLGNSTTSYGAASSEAVIIADRDAPFSMGQFIWTGFDYIGEPTPYHTKNSYYGQLDTATFKKDTYYVYQAEWTDYRKKPMVHIFPYWDFSIGQLIDVRVCSNTPLIELFLNDKLIGIHKIDHAHGKQLVGTWKLPYEPGVLKAIAYDEDGNVIATDIRRSFGDASKIHLKADKHIMNNDGQDLIFVEINMKDKQGNIVENANNRVNVKVSGEGRLLGLDNGDSTDYDQYKGRSRRLFNGKLMAIIGSTFESGKIQLEVSSKGMDTEILELESVSSNKTSIDNQEDGYNQQGISATTENSDLPILTGHVDEVPLRKIELVVIDDNPLDRKLNSSRNSLTVRAVLHPANTSYTDVKWSIVNDAGIPTNMATIDADGLEARITAMADGEFYLRCTSHNGTDKVKLISHLEFTASEIGSYYKDPYNFLSAGLYDYSKGKVGNGNEKGIATASDAETMVGYSNIDFGEYGSDLITMPIFALNDEAYTIEIWEGIPGEDGSSLLTEEIYQKPSIWNVYQEVTYKLPKRLKGLTSISFVLQKKVHIKGFYFEKINRAFEQVNAKDYDKIYGDDYKIRENGTVHVGNNVFIEFNNMDFTNEGTTKVTISGKSYIDKNSIIIRFEGKDGESRSLLTFTKSEDITNQVFEIKKTTDVHKVTFIFLPGCDFDFESFKFSK